MTASSHDALFKATFGQADIARSELEAVLPIDVVAHLDMATLSVRPGSFIDDELQQVHSDLLYAVETRAGATGLVYVVFEHQSSSDATMPFRLLKYMVRVWDRWLRDNPGAKTLPVVLPVVLHHGEGRWRGATEFAAMLDADEAFLDAVRPFQPTFRILLDDLRALSLEELAARTMHALGRLVQLAFWSARSMERLASAAPLMGEVAQAVERDARTKALLTQLYAYLWRAAPTDVAVDDIRGILLQVAGPQGAEDVVNAADQLIEQGRAEGRTELLAGLRAGVLAALSARSVALSEMGRARLFACTDPATLTRWLTRAVSASSEAIVFGTSDAP